MEWGAADSLIPLCFLLSLSVSCPVDLKICGAVCGNPVCLKVFLLFRALHRFSVCVCAPVLPV